MKKYIVAKEYPFLQDFFSEGRMSFIEDVSVKRLGTDVLKISLGYYEHSWSGGGGTRAWAVFSDGEWEKMAEGESGSDNGRLWHGADN